MKTHISPKEFDNMIKTNMDAKIHNLKMPAPDIDKVAFAESLCKAILKIPPKILDDIIFRAAEGTITETMGKIPFSKKILIPKFAQVGSEIQKQLSIISKSGELHQILEEKVNSGLKVNDELEQTIEIINDELNKRLQSYCKKNAINIIPEVLNGSLKSLTASFLEICSKDLETLKSMTMPIK